jgi:hypothetical protein
MNDPPVSIATGEDVGRPVELVASLQVLVYIKEEQTPS